MSIPDLNLLLALDAVLAEGSVAGAARRLRLSPSAMSRALARLRAATGDPLLVRAGRGLVPTPRALVLRTQVGQLVHDAQAVLRPALQLDLSRLQRQFILRTRDGFVEQFGAAIVARACAEAPGVRLSFLAKPGKDSDALRDGSVDLETGVVGAASGPELRVQALFRDRFVGVVRHGHPLVKGKLSAQRYAAARHVGIARSAEPAGPVDAALATLGLERTFATVVGAYVPALALARASDLVATVPERHTALLREGMHSFALPFAMPDMTVSMLWHPRMHADPAHQWLRGIVLACCALR